MVFIIGPMASDTAEYGGILGAPSHLVAEGILILAAFRFLWEVFYRVLYVSVRPSITHGSVFLSIWVLWLWFFWLLCTFIPRFWCVFCLFCIFYRIFLIVFISATIFSCYDMSAKFSWLMGSTPYAMASRDSYVSPTCFSLVYASFSYWTWLNATV